MQGGLYLSDDILDFDLSFSILQQYETVKTNLFWRRIKNKTDTTSWYSIKKTTRSPFANKTETTQPLWYSAK